MRKIAFGGIYQESSTFTAMITQLDDFHIVKGSEVIAGDLAQICEKTDISPVPVFQATALPGGPVALEAYETLCNDFTQQLKIIGPVDAVMLELHGAMVVEKLGQGDTDFIKRIRAQVGEGVLIAASFDLHGNIDPAIGLYCNIISGYRTAPHTDVLETSCRALEILIYCIANSIYPSTFILPVPILLPGEKVITEVEPALSLYAKLPKLDLVEDILCTSIFVGFAWADTPATGASVAVTAKRTSELQKQIASSRNLKNNRLNLFLNENHISY